MEEKLVVHIMEWGEHVDSARCAPGPARAVEAILPATFVMGAGALFVLRNDRLRFASVPVDLCQECMGIQCAVEGCPVARRCATCGTPASPFGEDAGPWFCREHSPELFCDFCDAPRPREGFSDYDAGFKPYHLCAACTTARRERIQRLADAGYEQIDSSPYGSRPCREGPYHADAEFVIHIGHHVRYLCLTCAEKDAGLRADVAEVGT